MAVSHTLVVAAVLSSLLVCGRADLCAPDCSGGSDFFPHPQDCNSYYRCSHGTALLLHCPEGLEFSLTGLGCDYPAQAGCTSDPARECGVPIEAPPTTLEVIKCIPDCETADALYPHPHDCTKYYQCVRRLPSLTSCLDGHEYSESLMRCDIPELAKCTAHADVPCLTTTVNPLTVCAPKCQFSGLYLAHPQDCSKFYICGGDGPVEFSCQQGLLYHREERRCNYPENFTCLAGPHRACDEVMGG